jgi:hypothetical protein
MLISRHSVGVRRVLIAAVAAAASLAAVPAANASCSSGISWNGGFYYGTSVAVGEGASLSGGYIPGCDDNAAVDPSTGARLTPQPAPTPVELHRIPGVPAKIAVSYGKRAYLAPGWLPQLPGHPLHRRFRAAPVRRSSCGAPWKLRGSVEVAPPPGVPVLLRSGPVGHPVTIVSRTRVRGLHRAGLPYLAAGDPVEAVVRTCGDQLVAARISRTS